jgi:hypothetical protein
MAISRWKLHKENPPRVRIKQIEQPFGQAADTLRDFTDSHDTDINAFLAGVIKNSATRGVRLTGRDIISGPLPYLLGIFHRALSFPFLSAMLAWHPGKLPS